MRSVNEADAIRNLQRYLRQLSYTDGSIPPLPIDGIFDSATRDALMAFQRKNSLAESGVADRETWDLLYLKYLESLKENAVPEGFSPFPRLPKKDSLSLGDESFAVSAVQFMLNEISVIQDALEPLIIDGVYGPATERAVTVFQRGEQLPLTGEVDLAVWNALVAAYKNHGIDYVQ